MNKRLQKRKWGKITILVSLIFFNRVTEFSTRPGLVYLFSCKAKEFYISNFCEQIKNENGENHHFGIVNFF